MLFSTTIATLALGAALSASQAYAVVHDVTVGGNDLVFSPEAIFANVGDQIVFHFQPKNHTVTQSSLAAPCSKVDGGLDSGFMPVLANQTDNFPTFTVEVKDTKPLWFYCAQAAATPNFHCGKGMVFSANCGADGQANSFTNFKKAALAIGAQLAASAPATPPAPSAPAPSAPAPSGTAPAPSPATSGGAVINVKVGGATPIFDPAHVKANVGDTVVFTFQPGTNHTVTQSGFAAPCARLANNAGFDSGFVAVGKDATALPSWNITVNDTKPIWAYCQQGKHCGSGMVFAINSDDTSDKSFDKFQALAKQLNGTAAANGTTGGAPPAGTAAAAGANSSAARAGASVAAFVLGAAAVLFSL